MVRTKTTQEIDEALKITGCDFEKLCCCQSKHLELNSNVKLKLFC